MEHALGARRRPDARRSASRAIAFVDRRCRSCGRSSSSHARSWRSFGRQARSAARRSSWCATPARCTSAFGDTVHPVLNLASARLIAGTPANPEVVSAAAIDNAKRGPLVGIPGAPATISTPLATTNRPGRSAMTRRAPPSSPAMYLVDGLALGPRRSRHAPLGERGDDLSAVRRLARQSRPAQPRRRAGAEPRRHCAAACFARPAGCDARGAAHRRARIFPAPAHRARCVDFPVGTVVRVPARPPRTTTSCSPTVCNASARSPRTSSASPMHRTAATSPLSRLTSSGLCPILDTLRVSAFPERGGVSNDAIVCARWRLSPTWCQYRCVGRQFASSRWRQPDDAGAGRR